MSSAFGGKTLKRILFVSHGHCKLLITKTSSDFRFNCEHRLGEKELQFGLSFREPLAEVLLHGLPAVPAAVVHRGDDLQGPKPLDETLHLQKAAVLTVRDACREKQKGSRHHARRVTSIMSEGLPASCPGTNRYVWVQ